MKKLALILLTLFALQGFSMQAQDFKSVKEKKLPDAAQSMISNYWPTSPVVEVLKGKDEKNLQYKVSLKDGTFIVFDKKGEWQLVRNSKGISKRFLPSQTQEYLNEQYPGKPVVRVERGARKNKVVVRRDNHYQHELYFYPDGMFYYEKCE